MCRYAFHIYKPRFACFECRKSFRVRDEDEMSCEPKRDEQGRRIAFCPQCRARMYDIGIDFRVPKKSDSDAWQVARLLASVGARYQGCGCDARGQSRAH